MSGQSNGNGDHSLRWLKRAVAFPYFWLLLFFLAPFLIILKISVADPITAQPPCTSLLQWGEHGVEGIRVTFANFAFLGQDRYYRFTSPAAVNMVGTGTLCCQLLGYPMD